MDINFKRYTFGTNNIRNQIMSQATDSANKNISQQVLAELDILVPSSPNQEAGIDEFLLTPGPPSPFISVAKKNSKT